MKRYLAVLFSCILFLINAGYVYADDEPPDAYVNFEEDEVIESIYEEFSREQDIMTPDLSGGIVTSIRNSRFLSNISTVKMDFGEDLSYLYYLMDLLSVVEATVSKADIDYPDISLTVDWKLDDVDTSVPGRYRAVGTVIPPTGGSIADGVLKEIIIPIEVLPPKSQDPVQVIDIYDQYYAKKGIFLPVGHIDSWNLIINERLETIENLIGVPEDYSREVELDMVTFDTSQVDINKVGDYTITVTLKLNEEFTENYYISDEFFTLLIPVRITDPKRFDIFIYNNNQRAFMGEWWIELTKGPEALYLIDSSGNLTLEQLAKAKWEVCPEEMVHILGIKSFSIIREELQLNTYYYFRLKSGNRLSNIIQIYDDGKSAITFDHGGDRDGGDAEGMQPPDTVQPPPFQEKPSRNSGRSAQAYQIKEPTPEPAELPLIYINEPEIPLTEPLPDLSDNPVPDSKTADEIIPPDTPEEPVADILTPNPIIYNQIYYTQKNTSEPEKNQTGSAGNLTFSEISTETQTVISGRRLKDMCADGDRVIFEKNGVAVKILSASLSALNLEDNQPFSLTLTKQDKGTISLELWANDEPVTELKDIQIVLPYEPINISNTYKILDQSGNELTIATFNKITGLLSFTVDAPGIYSIVDTQAETVPANPPNTDKVDSLHISKLNSSDKSSPNHFRETDTYVILLVLCCSIALLSGITVYIKNKR